MNTAVSTRLRVTAIVALLAFSMAVLLPTSAMADASTQQATNTPHTLSAFVQATGTFTSGALNGQAGSFNGLVNITRFDVVNNQIVAVGTLYGTVIGSTGAQALPSAGVPVSFPVAGIDPTCQILNLTLGPLDLNLLGLQVHLNQVVLNITAVSGAGNLLGNLLCAVANLLNTFPPTSLSTLLTDLTNLLNQILAAL